VTSAPFGTNSKIQTKRELDLPGRRDVGGRAKRWVVWTGDAVSVGVGNRAREIRGSIDGINRIHIHPIEEVEDFDAGFTLEAFREIDESVVSKLKCPLFIARDMSALRFEEVPPS
jgi:hypothetical protein